MQENTKEEQSPWILNVMNSEILAAHAVELVLKWCPTAELAQVSRCLIESC